jgi:glycosyltransferase involved in cell wall biosynthesis
MCDRSDLKVEILSPLYRSLYLKNKKIKVNGRWIPVSARILGIINNLIAQNKKTYKADLVHETYYSSNQTVPGNHKVLITIHDMIHELFPQYYGLLDQTSKIKKDAARRADHIICVSENTKRDVVRLYNINPEKISVIHHGHELNVTPFEGRVVQEPFILFVGSRSRYKNFDKLIDVYFSNKIISKNFKLVFFGDSKLSNNETQIVKKHDPDRSRIHFISGNDKILATLYNTAELFVNPSLYEGFGLTTLEAMSFGCPVVCSNTSCMPEIVGDAAVQFDPLSNESMSRALIEVLFDATTKKTLKTKGFDRASQFTWKCCADKTFQLYSNTIGNEIVNS